MRHLAAGAIAGFGIAVVVAVVAISFLSVQEGTYAGANRSKYADHANGSVLPSARAEQEACARASEPSEDETEQREKDDLCAQYRNALAAERMFALADSQSWLNYFQAVALAFSLIFTGWAAREAARAAKAAEEAVEQNEETSKLELRAYVGLESADVEGVDAPEGVTVSFGVKNTGQTMAWGVCFWGGVRFQKSTRYKINFRRAFGATLDDFSEETVLMPGASHHWQLTIPREEFDKHRAALLNGTERLVLAGLIVYLDIFNDDHDFDFAREMDVSLGLRDGPMAQWGREDKAD